MQPKISKQVKFPPIECWNRQQWQELDRHSLPTGLCQSEDFSCQNYIGSNMLNGYDHI